MKQLGSQFTDMLADFSLITPDCDVPITYYVSGYISKHLVKGTKCTNCQQMFTKNFESIEITDLDQKIAKKGEAFLDAINRGGLIKPSHLVTCIHISDLLQHIRGQPNLLNFLMGCGKSRAVFTETFVYKLQDSQKTISLLKATCSKGHDFKDVIRKIAASMFNMISENILQEWNDEIHKSRKRANTNAEEPEVNRDRCLMKEKS